MEKKLPGWSRRGGCITTVRPFPIRVRVRVRVKVRVRVRG